jgi:hypothetical protein
VAAPAPRPAPPADARSARVDLAAVGDAWKGLSIDMPAGAVASSTEGDDSTVLVLDLDSRGLQLMRKDALDGLVAAFERSYRDDDLVEKARTADSYIASRRLKSGGTGFQTFARTKVGDDVYTCVSLGMADQALAERYVAACKSLSRAP